jgi:L-asparaginase/Glu-tRNA(Gln) amidotransferase subunit D
VKPVVFTASVRKRTAERGTREENVIEAIRIGEQEPAQRGLVLYRLNLEFHREWDGRYYRMQQVAPVVAEEPDRIVVIMVYSFYFQEGGKS